MLNTAKLFDQAAKLTVNAPQGGTGNSKLSLGIICSRKNGKRLHLSKALKTALQIDNRCELKPANANTLLLGRNLGIPGVISGKVKDDEGRGIMYHTAGVMTLINHFQLNFSNGRTSRSFDQITLDTAPNGEPVAVIIMNGNCNLNEFEEVVEAETIAADDEVSDEEDIMFDDDVAIDA